MFNSKKRVKDLSAPGAAAGPAGTVAAAAASPGLPGLGPTSAGNIQKLEMAKRLALKINAQKNLGAEAQVSLNISVSVNCCTGCRTNLRPRTLSSCRT